MLKNERTKSQNSQQTGQEWVEETIASGSGNPATADNKGGQKLKDQKASKAEVKQSAWQNLANQEFLKGAFITIASKTAKVFTVEGLKLVCKTGSKIIPVVGNIVGAVDDIYQSYQIGSLEETTASLRNVQSTMEGQIEDLQAGLKEAKDRELQLAQDHKNLQDQLNKSNTETKTELELQKQALEEAISANNATKEQLQTSIEATQTQIDEVKNRMNDSEKAIEILQSTSLSHEEKITNLNSLIEKEKERINAFETKMDSFEDQLNDQQKQLDTHQKKISQLHQAHLDLEKQVEENKNNIRHNSTNINLFSQNLREQIQKQNQLEEEQRRMKWEAQEKARKDKEIAEKQAKLQKEIQANQTRTQKVEKELDQLKTEIRQKEFSQQKTEDKLSKLIKYTQLKEERQTLRKQLAQYADLPDSKEYFKQFEKPIIEAKEQIALQYEAHEDWKKKTKLPHKKKKLQVGLPLKPGSYLERKFPHPKDLFEQTGFQVCDEGIEHDIGQAVWERYFLQEKYKEISIVDVSLRDKLIFKLEKNQLLYGEICRDLDLESIFQEEMKKEREEEEKARKEKLQKEQEEQRKKSEKKKKITKKFRAVVINKQGLTLRHPGTTKSLQFPWWLLFLISILLAVFCNICHDYLLPLLVKRLFKKEVKCENCALKMKEFPDENYNLCPKCLVKHYLQAANSNNREEIQLKESQLEVEQPEPEPET